MKIKSYRGKYEVVFKQNIKDTITPDEKSFFIVDREVEKYNPDLFKDAKNVIFITAEECNKDLEYSSSIISSLIEKNIKKNCVLIAVGGGITQDITCFIASTLFRGISWYFVPTTLLSQADSCIGSKSSINFKGIKNLLGNFYPPKKIFCCSDFLKSLPIQQIKSGLGEILHFLFIGNSKLLHTFVSDYDNLLELSPTIDNYIEECLSIKKKTIEKDEFDTGVRQINNFGHTFGHALETATDYNLSHGQAVTMGMSIANFISLNLEFIDSTTYNFNQNIINVNLPEVILTKEQKALFFAALKKDKKNINNSLVCILQKKDNKIFWRSNATSFNIHTLENFIKVEEIINIYFKNNETSI